MAIPAIEQPVTVSDGRDGTKTTHPAFGQIGAYRVQGHGGALYASDFKHNASMRIRISRSQLNRSLSRDWHHGREEVIEVEMSEAQWATFISSPNMGSGTPCTIRHIKGEMTPHLPDPVDRSKQFAGEADETLDDTVKLLRSALKRMDDMGMPKGKTAELRAALEKAIQELTANLPFVASQFGEHVESTVEAAKQEIHGYMQGVISRAGITALSAGDLPLQIDYSAKAAE